MTSVCILGVAAPTGARLVRDLAATPAVTALTVLDPDGAAARAAAAQVAGISVQAAVAQPAEREALTLALEGCDVLVDAAGAGTAAMDAALATCCAYLAVGAVDAAEVLDGAFAAADLIAVVGCAADDICALVGRLAGGALADAMGLPLAGVRPASTLAP